MGDETELQAVTWAQLPPPHPSGLRDLSLRGLAGPGRGGWQEGDDRAVGWRDVLSTQRARADVSPASAQPRRVPACSLPQLLFPQTICEPQPSPTQPSSQAGVQPAQSINSISCCPCNKILG